jgi:HPt (histidine-containing phosphotransfer) domain-containing protein
MENLNEKTVDLTFLTSMTGGNKEKMKKYIGMFLQHAPTLVSQLDDNLRTSDWSGLKTTVHTLKSQFSYMGANEAKELALLMEKNADSNTNVEQFPSQVERIKLLFSKASAELNDELTRL